VNVTFGAVRGPEEVIADPQLTANGIIVPLEGAGATLATTISSPFQVHGVVKTPARRGPDIGEHSEEILRELGFDAKGIADLRATGTIPGAVARAA
jgi:formyl-CoA transferase